MASWQPAKASGIAAQAAIRDLTGEQRRDEDQGGPWPTRPGCGSRGPGQRGTGSRASRPGQNKPPARCLSSRRAPRERSATAAIRARPPRSRPGATSSAARPRTSAPATTARRRSVGHHDGKGQHGQRDRGGHLAGGRAADQFGDHSAEHHDPPRRPGLEGPGQQRRSCRPLGHGWQLTGAAGAGFMTKVKPRPVRQKSFDIPNGPWHYWPA